MMFFLNFLVIYLLSVVLSYIICYINWICDKDSFGRTINDLHEYIDEEYPGIIMLIWFPVLNILMLIILIVLSIWSLFFNLIKDIKIR